MVGIFYNPDTDTGHRTRLVLSDLCSGRLTRWTKTILPAIYTLHTLSRFFVQFDSYYTT